MIDISDFTAHSKSMLIAPAGYGKTFTISSSLKFLSGKGKQLILTHTHAGIAAIREKVVSEGVSKSDYSIETISSFSQRYVQAFHSDKDIPNQDEGKVYYSFILEKATVLLARDCVSSIVAGSYSGLFVDEYQDCSLLQHNFIKVLSRTLPTRILGDPLQGIFGFNGDNLVDLENSIQMDGFADNIFVLKQPQRWMRGNNTQLGEDLKSIRELLLSNSPIDITSFDSVESHVWPALDVYKGYSDYSKKVRNLLDLKNVLFIHPVSHNVNSRLNFSKQFGGRLHMLESIDAKELYELAEIADRIDTDEPILLVREMSFKLFNKTGLAIWFNDNGFKRKNNQNDRNTILSVTEYASQLKTGCSPSSIAELLKLISELPGIKKYRRDLYNSIYWALKEAESDNVSVRTAMENRRNKLRRVGRKIYGRCIGTTLLTKGLEFDNVVVLNADQFDCPKHLYVALTRASKRLIVISAKKTLHPV